MALPKSTKQPYEKFFIGVDFTLALEETEDIDLGSSAVTAVDKDGDDATSIIIESGSKQIDTAEPEDVPYTPQDDAMLSARVQGGIEDDSPYKLTYRIVTTAGNQYEKDVKLKVKEL